MILCPFEELKRYAPLLPGVEEAVDVISQITDWTPRTIPLSGGNRIMVQQYATHAPEESKPEAHRQFLDIQYIVEGEETFGWAKLDTLTPAGEFSQEKDVGYYDGFTVPIRVLAGNCYVVFPEDGHNPGIYHDHSITIRKIVVKLKV